MPAIGVVRYKGLRQHGQSTAMIFRGFNGKPLLSGARDCFFAGLAWQISERATLTRKKMLSLAPLIRFYGVLGI